MLGSLIKNCEIESCDVNLEMVKNAMIFIKNKIVYIKHYNTIIFAYDAEHGITEADFDCSPTSNRQIDYALKYFGIVKASVINTHEGSKMEYSEPLT